MGMIADQNFESMEDNLLEIRGGILNRLGVGVSGSISSALKSL
jgi:hypothetical protein